MKRKIDKDFVASDFLGKRKKFEDELSDTENDDKQILALSLQSPSTKSSGSSEEKIGGRPTKRSRVSLGSGGFAATEQRGRTEVGPQVEHASAYVLFEELIYSNLEGVKISNAPKALAEVFECFPLSKKTIEKMKEKAQNAKETITRDERKDLTRSIRGTNYLAEHTDFLKALLQEKLSSLGDDHQEEEEKIAQCLEGLVRISKVDVLSVKDAMKLANRANFSSVVADIMDGCIFGANKMIYASLPNEGVPTNPNTGKERTAKDNLRFLSEFLLEVKKANCLFDSVEEKDKAKAAKIRLDLEQDKNTIKKLEEVWNIKKETAQDLINGTIEPDDIFDDVAEKISEHVGQLFYYPKIDSSKMHEYEIDGKKAKWAVSEEEWQKVTERKKYNKGAKPRNNDPEILYQLAGRHLVLIFNCFRGLGCFGVRNQKQITDNFLQNSVLDEQGWDLEHGKSSSSALVSHSRMGLKPLEVGVENHATLDHQRGIFYASDSTRSQQEKTKGISSQPQI